MANAEKPPTEGLKALARKIADENERRRKYGLGRPIISIDFKGTRFVAVGNRLYHSKDWRTFPDFLFYYIRHVFGGGWGEKELAKALPDRHPVAQWYDHLCRVQKKQAEDEGLDESGLYSVVPDGVVAAYVRLAYDLYTLRDHGKLQQQVLKRLRRADLFRGARYELLVAALFIRAGFDIAYEDEADGSKAHPEFVATHRQTGFVMAVEAKVRHRDPTGMPSRPGVGGLLRDAARKRTSHPFAVFVEVALPPESSPRPGWLRAVQQELTAVGESLGEPTPFDLVMFTNIPHQYGEDGQPDPDKHFFAVWPRGKPRIPEALVNALGEAAKQYGNVPQEFPAD
jgi:hypothetical protein